MYLMSKSKSKVWMVGDFFSALSVDSKAGGVGFVSHLHLALVFLSRHRLDRDLDA